MSPEDTKELVCNSQKPFCPLLSIFFCCFRDLRSPTADLFCTNASVISLVSSDASIPIPCMSRVQVPSIKDYPSEPEFSFKKEKRFLFSSSKRFPSIQYKLYVQFHEASGVSDTAIKSVKSLLVQQCFSKLNFVGQECSHRLVPHGPTISTLCRAISSR